MALIKCTECGKEFSDKAPACPNCGCPVGDMDFNLTTDENVRQEGTASKIVSLVKDKAQEAVESYQNSYHTTKQIGPIQIDEPHQAFRINGAIPINGKKDGIGKGMFKGMMAFSTMGMSVAAEKMLGGGNKQKVGNKEWFNFSDLLSYDLLEDDSIVTSGGVGQALIGGAIFGGFGAIAGGVTGTRVQKKKVESLYIKITTNSFSSPCSMLPLITKPTKTSSKEYQVAFNLAHQILSALDVITHNKT